MSTRLVIGRWELDSFKALSPDGLHVPYKSVTHDEADCIVRELKGHAAPLVQFEAVFNSPGENDYHLLTLEDIRKVFQHFKDHPEYVGDHQERWTQMLNDAVKYTDFDTQVLVFWWYD